MKNSGNYLIGMVAAATAGVILGMLIAPEKGSVLRTDIKNRAGDWTKKLADLLAEGKEQLKNFASSVESAETQYKPGPEKPTMSQY